MRPHNQSTPNPKSTVRVDDKAHMKHSKQPKHRLRIKLKVTKFSTFIQYDYTTQAFKPSDYFFQARNLIKNSRIGLTQSFGSRISSYLCFKIPLHSSKGSCKIGISSLQEFLKVSNNSIAWLTAVYKR
jgi:hypothetical protein